MFNIFKSTEKKLEEAILKLETDLRNNDLRFLVEVMASDEIYSPLLHQRRQTEISSKDYISWYGYRRAEKLESENDKQTLLSFLDDNKLQSKKRHVYFALAHLCKNRTDDQLFNFLMNRLEEEKDPDFKIAILIGIESMDKTASSINIEPIKTLAKGRSRELKIKAICALQKTNDTDVEPLLLKIFEGTKDSHIKNMICTPLETVGSEKSIPVLNKAYKNTRDYILRDGIERTLEEIDKRHSTTKN
ncbi:MAG: HEAT repeat domain-containing protein [Bacteroidia bacterium]